MALISMQDVSVGYGGPLLLEGMNLQIEEGERLCLIGRNGVGKSTLMKLITGEVEANGGSLTRSPALKVACLTQVVPDGLDGTVFDQISHGLGATGKLLAKYHLLSHRMATEEITDRLMSQLDDCQHELDHDNAWQMNVHVETIIEKMSLDPDADFASLSAGMKRRVLLAQAMVREPDLLLLDEPTNHLDIEAITWIEEFLGRFAGCLMFVSHDRAFLKRLSTRIIELDRGQLASFACDYETYLKRKEVALEAESTEQALFDKKLAREEVWIRKGVQGRRTRNEGRIRALKQMRKERSERKELMGTARLTMQDARQSGRLVIEAKKVSFAYDEEFPLIKDFSTVIMRGDKIGIIGPNGSGKTTLLRVLLQELTVQKGNIRHGANIEIAYFDQLHAQLDDHKSIYDNISDGGDTVVINGNSRHIMGYLRDFMFTPDQARSPVGNLSGGERNRLLLAKLFTKPSNLLVLDEPTNDLDIETLDLLEEFIVNYPGTILMVSHDREFLNNVVTSTMVLEGEGVVEEYIGGYDDWLRQSQQRQIKTEEPVAKKPEKPAPKDSVRKLTYKEKQELETLPAIIESLETQQAEIETLMAAPNFYKKGKEVTTTTTQLTKITQELKTTYTRWESLESLK